MLTPTQKRLYEVASYLSHNLDFFNKNNCFFKAGTEEAMLVAKYKMLDKVRDPYLVDIIYKITEEGSQIKLLIEVKNKTGKYEKTQKTLRLDNIVNDLQNIIRATVDTVEATMQKTVRGGYYVQDREVKAVFTDYRQAVINFAYNNNLVVGIDEKSHINEGVNILFKDPNKGKSYLYVVKQGGSIYNTQTRENVGDYSIQKLVNEYIKDRGY